MEKKCGIYKITSPNGKIYIGLSTDIYKRWRNYRRLECKTQSRLYNSFKKHGVENHTFEIIHECEFVELNKWEKHYVDFFQTFNTEHGLNLRDGGGSKGKSSEDTKRKQSESQIGEKNHNFGKKQSEETRRKKSEATKGEKNGFFGKTHSKETRLKISKSVNGKHIGRKHSEVSKKNMSNAKKGEKNGMFGKRPHNFGKSPSEETKLKISEGMTAEKNHNFGKKQSAETIAKRVSKTTGKKRTEASKKRMSESRKKYLSDDSIPKKSYIGEFHPMFGKTHSAESKLKISKTHKGVKKSKESILKRTETRARIRQERLTMIF